MNTSQPPSGGEVVADARAISDVATEAAVPIIPNVLNLGSAVELEDVSASQPPSGEEIAADAHATLDVRNEAAVPIVPSVLNLSSPVELEDVGAFLLTDVTEAPQYRGSLPSHSTDDLGSDWSDVEEEQS